MTFFKLGNMFTAIIGVLGLKVSAYAQPLLIKAFKKKHEDMERADVRSKMADVRCTLRHCCVTFFVKDLFKCKKRSTFVTVCCNVFTLLVYI